MATAFLPVHDSDLLRVWAELRVFFHTVWPVFIIIQFEVLTRGLSVLLSKSYLQISAAFSRCLQHTGSIHQEHGHAITMVSLKCDYKCACFPHWIMYIFNAETCKHYLSSVFVLFSTS